MLMQSEPHWNSPDWHGVDGLGAGVEQALFSNFTSAMASICDVEMIVPWKMKNFIPRKGTGIRTCALPVAWRPS